MKRFTLSALGLMVALSSVGAVPAAWAHGDEHIDPNMKVDHPIEAADTDFGRQGKTREVTRTIDISMSDMMRFTPDSLNIKQGETVRLRIKNDGKVPHEFVLGTKAEITEHAELMKKNPEMEHADASAARVAPGKTSEIIWQFTKPGQFLYACLMPGHWDAGMQGTVTVTGAKAAAANATGNNSMAGMKMAANDDMKSMPVTDTTRPAATDDRYTQGVVRKVDTAQGKLTIKHGDIKNLGMPGMTMVFKVKDPRWLLTVKPGDNVMFVVEKQEGALVITDLSKAP